jgi:hypothetical protein
MYAVTISATHLRPAGCSSYGGQRFRGSTEEEDLPQAKWYAEDWLLELRGKARAGLHVEGWLCFSLA